MSTEMISHCPACGAEMQVHSAARQIICSFCGNRYSVDTSASQPVMHLLATPGDVEEIPPETPLVPESVPETPQIARGANTFDFPPVPATPRVEPVPAQRRPLWLIITLIFGALLCLIFGCMAAAYALFSNSGQFLPGM